MTAAKWEQDVRLDHERTLNDDGLAVCTSGGMWPCDTAQALAALDAERALADRLAEALELDDVLPVVRFPLTLGDDGRVWQGDGDGLDEDAVAAINTIGAALAAHRATESVR